MNNPNAVDNLKPFKKGEGGRTKGAKNKKTKAIQQLAQDVLELDPYSGEKMTPAETERFFKWWIMESPVAARHFLEHAHGKAPDKLDVNVKKWICEGPNGEPVTKKKPDDTDKQD